MKRNIPYRIFIFSPVIILLSAFLTSCGTSQPAFDSKDLSYLYNPSKNPVNPRYNVSLQSSESSILTVKFLPGDLYFSEANPQGLPIAVMVITVKLYDISAGRRLIDTAAYNLNIVKDEARTDYIYNVPLRVQPGLDYMAEVKILDRVRMRVIQAFVPFNTLTPYNKYNFRVLGHSDRNMIIDPVLRRDEFVNLIYDRGFVDTLFISYYPPLTAIPDPPSLLLPERTIDYEPDTTVALPYNDALPLMFPMEGVYLCSVDREIADGYSFFNFGETYPELNSPEKMLEPLAYLTSSDELAVLKSGLRPKASLDEFWIGCGGNVEKSRELIRIFYTRVRYSNYYFTSFKEGWRTERGMVYIIYGPPDKVYKTSDGELWGYRKPTVRTSWGGRFRVKEDYLFFTFRKRNSVFSDNDFYVSRTETLVTQWDQAVASWRKGIVFRFDNPGDI